MRHTNRVRAAARRAALFFFVAGLLAITSSLLLQAAWPHQATYLGLGALDLLIAALLQLFALPILTALFVLGRILFWVGYHKHPYLRAFGFGITFYPSVAVYIWYVLLILFGIRIPLF